MYRTWAARFLAELRQPATDLEWFVDIDENGRRARRDVFRLIVGRYALSETVEQFAERYQQDFCASFRCAPDVVASLQRARRVGYRVAIITNGDTRAQGTKIAAAGLGELVDALVISEQEGARKPDAALFRVAASRCGENFEGGWMIGDNPVNDIAGAAAVGLRTAWIRLGRTWEAELEFTPTWQVDAFSEAVDLILGDA
jgi:putative hydrolase of the HAD superfamily